MGGGVFLYLIMLGAVALMHTLFFGRPYDELWFRADHASSELFNSPIGTPQGWIYEWIQEPLSLTALEVDVALGVTLGLGFVGLTRWMSAQFAWARQLDEEFSAFFRGTSASAITALAISSSLAEEIIFRGWLQGYLGLALTSLIFGLLHIPPKKSHWPWTVSALTMGFVFGALYDWRGSVTAPFIAHFTINFFNLQSLANRGEPRPREREISL